MERREFIAVAGATAVASFAGCLSSGDPESPEDAVEEYYEAIMQDDQDEIADLLHPESPLLSEGEGNETDTPDLSIESIESVETRNDDIDSDYLDSEGVSPARISMEDFQALLEDEDAALVDITYMDSNQNEQTDLLLAAEDGIDWHVLDTATEG